MKLVISIDLGSATFESMPECNMLAPGTKLGHILKAISEDMRGYYIGSRWYFEMTDADGKQFVRVGVE